MELHMATYVFKEVRGELTIENGWSLPFIPVTVMHEGEIVKGKDGEPLIIRREFRMG